MTRVTVPTRLRLAVAATALGGASCASLLGVDGDYVDRGAGGDTASSTSTSGVTTVTGATTSTGATAATTTTSSSAGGGEGGSGEGGAAAGGGDVGGGGDGGSASSAGGGGSGGGDIDCDVLQCAERIESDLVPVIASRPRLRKRTTEHAWLTLLGQGTTIWRGTVGPDSVLGDTIGVSGVDAHAYASGDVGYLAGGDVLEAEVDEGPLESLAQSPLLGGPTFTPPLFVARQFQGDGKDLEVDRLFAVTVDGTRSTVFTCPEVPAALPCEETWSDCDPVPIANPPTHALIEENLLFAAARACGADRTLLVEAGGTPVPGFPAVTDVLEVDLTGAATLPVIALSVIDDGSALRSVRVDDGAGHTFDFGPRPSARQPTVTADMQTGVWGAWVETVGGTAILQTFHCDVDLTSCPVRQLHVDGGLAEDVARPQILFVEGLLYAWERGAGIVLARHPSNPREL